MSVSGQLRGFAESAYEVKEIPSHVKLDLEAFARDVYEIERERDERKVVTSEEHARVVHLYIDMIADKASENAKLRELALKNWYIALSEREALRAHNIDPDDGTYMAALDDEITTAKDRMRELGIEVDG